MKTSWVLTEDDKTKIGRRHGSGDLDQPSFSGSGEMNIKSEADSEIPNMDPDGEGRIKQRRPSSPMSPSARPSSHHFTNNTGDTFLSGLSRHFPTSAYGLYGSNYDPPSNNVQSMQGYFSCNTVANPMHVPLSFQQDISNNDLFSRTKSDAGSSLLGNPWSSVQSVQSEGRRHKRHHQQSRTIFRCVSGEGERDCDSRSTISSQLSDNERQTLSNSTEAAFSQLFQTEPNQESNSEDAVRDPINERLKVWKLQDIPFDDTNRSTLSPSPFSVVNTFTLQETLFIEQLTSIDERVRVQVPMEVNHGKFFLECAVSGSPISQMTIMHAYQTCIKRVVRFANSLQDFVELPPDDMQRLLVTNTVAIINIKISRWLSDDSDLKLQMGLLSTGQDLYGETVDKGRVTDELQMKVNYSDIFISPWCCDSSFEDRYEVLIKEMFLLELDPTTVVLLSVMCLFYVGPNVQLSSESNVASHQRKFSLLLQRYLAQSKGKDRAIELFGKYQDSLEKLHEMAEILINKRLICW